MPINLLDFSNQKPADGSNIVGASLVDYVIKAVSIPFESDNAIDVEGALNQLNELTIFQSSSGQLTQGPSRLDFKDLNLTRKTGYYFIQFGRLEAQDHNGLLLSASTYTEGDPFFNNLITGSNNIVDKTVFLEPFVEGRIDLSEYENNAIDTKTSTFRFVVDRDRSQLQPNNLEQITASLENATSRSLEASVQESNYYSTGWINGRYNGSKIFAIGSSYNPVGDSAITSNFFEDTPAISFVLKPISYDLARANAIETSDLVRKSAYSFEIHNNKLRIFPEPLDGDAGEKIWFEYYLKSDVRNTNNSNAEMTGGVSDPSNVPYKFITYNSINASGRQWIRKYTAALAKELLGIIRSKYSAMPIPDGEVTLDGEGLKAEGREEKTQLLEELKEFLESVSLTEKLKAEAEEANAQQEVLAKAPLPIYIG